MIAILPSLLNRPKEFDIPLGVYRCDIFANKKKINNYGMSHQSHDIFFSCTIDSLLFFLR